MTTAGALGWATIWIITLAIAYGCGLWRGRQDLAVEIEPELKSAIRVLEEIKDEIDEEEREKQT